MTDDPIVPDPTDPLDAEIADLLASSAPDAVPVPPEATDGQETPQDAPGEPSGGERVTIADVIAQALAAFLKPTDAALKLWELPTNAGRMFLAVSFGPNGAFGVYFDEPGLEAHWREVGAILGKMPEGITLADMNDVRKLGGGSPLS